MAKIPFDIKYKPQIESGEYKVFAHEHEEQEARIVCWDNKGEYPIVALVDNEPEKFDKHGRVPGGNRGGEFSLFIVTPEEELTPFEKKVADIIDLWHEDYVQWSEQGASAHNYPDQIKPDASELLAIAIDARAKELYKGLKQSKLDKDSIPYHLIEFMCNLYTCQNWKEIEETAEAYVTRIEAAALKDLPRWRQAYEYVFVGQSIMLDEQGFYFASIAKPGCLYITCDSLTKLSGFND